MGSRLELHDLLLSIAGPNVYYQAPSNLVMNYPCIRYSLNKIDNKHADNSVYKQDLSYSVIVISRQVDDNIVSNISKLPKCRFDTRYVKDNIYHTVFTLYY